jgi:hypothetical protein
MDKNILVGKIIKEIQIAADKQALLFVLEYGGSVKVRCDGDCCSVTWIEHINLPVNGLPALVTKVEAINMPDLGEMEGRDVVEYYGCKITTDKGEILIDYRNESNGYYGGNLCWPDDDGGIYSQNVSKEEWTTLTEDL